MWLDSGEAIARRVGNLLIAEKGAVRVRRAGFTDDTMATALSDAFSARGFSTLAAIGPTPGFEATPLSASASA